MTAGETHQAIEATFRIERARLIAGLARLVGSLDRAEDLAQDALVTAPSATTRPCRRRGATSCSGQAARPWRARSSRPRPR